MPHNHYHGGTAGQPRSGLIGTAEFDFQPNLITPLSADLVGEAGFEFDGTLSPGVTFSQIDASGTLVLDNYDVLSAHLVGRAIPIQSISGQSEVVWILDNIGGGTECCDVSSGGSSVEYTTLLSGLSYEIPRTVHGINGFPTVTVLKSNGTQVFTRVRYGGDSVFIVSHIPLDNHTAILR